MSRKKRRFPAVTNRLFLFLGILLLAVFAAYRINRLIRLPFAGRPPYIKADSGKSLATQIRIPAVKIDLDIYPVTISNGLWQIDDRGASFLFISARPGQAGPIVIYAHNTSDRFGPLRQLKLNDSIVLTTEAGAKYSYRVAQIAVVPPSSVDALTATTETLILYTCTGFLDRQRLIFKAVPIAQ